VQLTVHRKVRSVFPGFKVVSPAAVNDILSTSGPANTTFTSSTNRSYAKAISRVTTIIRVHPPMACYYELSRREDTRPQFRWVGRCA